MFRGDSTSRRTSSRPVRREDRSQALRQLDVGSQVVGDVPDGVAPLDSFTQLIAANDRTELFTAITTIEQQWHPGSAVMLVESYRFMRSDSTREAVIDLLENKTGQQIGADLNAWYHWIWRQEYTPHPSYALFKAHLYSLVDNRFREYFITNAASKIRLDEVRWGGVRRDGIPPLKDPKSLLANDAEYLSDTDVVFGVEISGESRAYPKRILAWHEMVKDTLGQESINGVYCTLCGSMIVYRTHVGQQHYELGTSGFLYRSNKLMYDHATKSLWSTLDGEPVIGRLVGKGIKLEPLYVVTTTWGQWRADHPATTVLSLETGHRRNYDEGVAYHDYFATDKLMFSVPELDTRLKNKDEILAIRLDARSDEKLAISADFLAENRVYHDQLGDTKFVVLTDETGANRVYESKGIEFVEMLDASKVRAADDRQWEITESGLASHDDETLLRLPAHRAFWFGWQAAFPTTRLVK